MHYVVDENKLFIDNIQKVDDSYVIPLSSQLLRSNSLSMQLVVNQDDSVFKSKIFKVSIADSIINAIQYTDDYKDWFQSIRDRLDLIEDLDLDEIVQIASNINSVISNHNADTSAHEDIRNAMLTSSDISSAISTHDSDSSAHSDIRTTLNGKASASDISTAIFTHNSSSDSHSDIRGLISNKASTSDINSAISNHDVDTSAHEDIRTSISSITPSIQTTLNGTCNANTKYYLGEVSTLSLTLPDEPSINDEIYISFYNPTPTATIISINDFYNGSIDNTEGYHGEIDLLYDGTIWNVAYIEQEVL